MYINTHTYIYIYFHISLSLFITHFSSEKLALIILNIFTCLINSSVCNPIAATIQMPSSPHLGSDTPQGAASHPTPTLPPHVKVFLTPPIPQDPMAGWGSCTTVDTILTPLRVQHLVLGCSHMGTPSLPYWGSDSPCWIILCHRCLAHLFCSDTLF